MRAENGYVEICPRQNSKSAKPPPNANLVHFLHRDCRTIVQIRVELNSTILLVISTYAYHVVENALVVRMICDFCKYLV